MPIETKSLLFLVRALNSRNFRLFFFGQAVSLIGTWMQLIAMRWLVYRLTKSELMLGIVGFVSDIPLFLLVPFAGVMADRLKRHRIMAVTQTLAALQAALLAVLVATDQIAVWHVLVLGALFLMKIREKTFTSSPLDVTAAFKEGAAYTFASVPIRSILLFVAVISLVASSYPLLMPVFAEDILHGGPRVFGYLMSGTGVGALAGAIFLASRKNIKGLGELIVAAGFLYGAGLIALSLSASLPIALSIALLLGFSLMMQMASSNTIVQTIVDDQKRGRVMSLFVMARRGIESLGSLLFGAVAHMVGPRPLYELAARSVLSLWPCLRQNCRRSATPPRRGQSRKTRPNGNWPACKKAQE